jgi:GNAT superfamily N-acetyltransferase
MRSARASAPDLLAAFDEQIRRRPVPDGPGDVVEREDGVVRCVSPTGWSGVTYSDLAGRDAGAAIAALIARMPGSWEWKHYSYDEPPDLPERLLAAGFEPEEPEALMFADLGAPAIDAPPPPGVELRIVDAERLGDLTRVHDAVFGGGHAGLEAVIRAGLARGTVVPIVAYAGGEPVGGGRLELADGTDFASLWGDCTLPEHRGRGIFRALVARRAEIARERGHRYLQVDAMAMSRPLFARLGFEELAHTTPFVHPGPR